MRHVLERNITTQLRKIAFSALVYGALVILCLGGIVWGLHYGFDGLLPIRWSSTLPVFEYPIDLLFYNFVVPLAARSIKPSDELHNIFDWWFHECARLLRLSDFFFGERWPDEEGCHVRQTWTDTILRRRGDVEHPVSDADAEKPSVYFRRDGRFVRAPASDQVRIPKSSTVFVEVTEDNERVDGAPDPENGLHGRSSVMFTMVYIPPSFRIRIAAFLFLMWVFTAATGLGITAFPLVIGRKIISSYLLPGGGSMVNDVYAISSGLCVIGVVAYLALWFRDGFSTIKERVIRPCIRSPRNACLQIGRAALQAIRLLYISAAFSMLLPFLFAVIIELYVLIPLHTYFGAAGEKHIIDSMQDWALGVIYVHMAIKFILWKSNSRLAVALQGIFRGGWTRPNVRLATRAFILPVLLLTSFAVFLPLTLGFAVKVASNGSWTTFKIYRYSYPITFVLGLSVWLVFFVHRQMDVWRAHIQDDVYLIGERLHNFPDRRVNNRSRAVR